MIQWFGKLTRFMIIVGYLFLFTLQLLHWLIIHRYKTSKKNLSLKEAAVYKFILLFLFFLLLLGMGIFGR